ncbi:unnamed protein product, partial [Ectocarpus sp. 12 AP-2014]
MCKGRHRPGETGQRLEIRATNVATTNVATFCAEGHTWYCRGIQGLGKVVGLETGTKSAAGSRTHMLQDTRGVRKHNLKGIGPSKRSDGRDNNTSKRSICFLTKP